MSGEQDRDALEVVVRGAQMIPYNDGKGGWLWRHATASEIAAAILASDWLADHDRRVRAAALREVEIYRALRIIREIREGDS